MKRLCVVAGCQSRHYDAGLCERHYRLRLRGVPVLPCPVCGEPMREPADCCGFCAREGLAA